MFENMHHKNGQNQSQEIRSKWRPKVNSASATAFARNQLLNEYKLIADKYGFKSFWHTVNSPRTL